MKTIQLEKQLFRFTAANCRQLVHVLFAYEQKELSYCLKEQNTTQTLEIEAVNGMTYLVLRNVCGKYIAVDSVLLEHKRKGTFTRVMTVVEEIVKNTTIGYIEITCVCTEDMKAWCDKQGYQVISQGDILCGDNSRFRVLKSSEPIE